MYVNMRKQLHRSTKKNIKYRHINDKMLINQNPEKVMNKLPLILEVS